MKFSELKDGDKFKIKDYDGYFEKLEVEGKCEPTAMHYYDYPRIEEENLFIRKNCEICEFKKDQIENINLLKVIDKKTGILLDGEYEGSGEWSVVAHKVYDDKILYELESDQYENTPHVIVNADKEVLLGDVKHGFKDYDESRKFEVKITETLSCSTFINALTKEDALEKAKEEYRFGNIKLNSQMWKKVNIDVTDSETAESISCDDEFPNLDYADTTEKGVSDEKKL